MSKTAAIILTFSMALALNGCVGGSLGTGVKRFEEGRGIEGLSDPRCERERLKPLFDLSPDKDENNGINVH